MKKDEALEVLQQFPPIPPSVSPEPQPLLSESAEADIRRWRESLILENRQRATVREFESHRLRQSRRASPIARNKVRIIRNG